MALFWQCVAVFTGCMADLRIQCQVRYQFGGYSTYIMSGWCSGWRKRGSGPRWYGWWERQRRKQHLWSCWWLRNRHFDSAYLLRSLGSRGQLPMGRNRRFFWVININEPCWWLNGPSWMLRCWNFWHFWDWWKEYCWMMMEKTKNKTKQKNK